MNCVKCEKELTGRKTKFCSKQCKRAINAMKHYNKNKETSNTSAKNRSIFNKVSAIKAMGNSCNLCGYYKNISALVFHHIDPNEKEFSPAYIISRRNNDTIEKELKKCQLLCQNCHHKLHFEEKKEYGKTYVKQREKGLDIKKELISYINNNKISCSKCGYDKSIASLAFHHLDESKKETSLSIRELIVTDLETLKKEADKCVVLCHNCHMEHHNYRLDWDKVKDITYSKKENAINKPNPFYCEGCGKKRSKSASKYCIECYKKYPRKKINWPPKERLEKLLINNNPNQVAKILEVSHSGLKRYMCEIKLYHKDI